MRKLIGMSIVALLAVTAIDTASAQVYYSTDYTTTKVKNKEGKHKVKVIPNAPYTYYPRTVAMYRDRPYYGYRNYGYYNGYYYRGTNPRVIKYYPSGYNRYYYYR